MTTTSNSTLATDPVAFLNDARQYQAAAEVLFGSRPDLDRVIYALYFHTVELLFKAYLLAQGEDPWGHQISKLYEESCRLGLKITGDELSLKNVVGLLETGNADMAFRYFSLKSSSQPDLAWAREVVENLLQAVSASVEPQAVSPTKAVKIIMTVSKPVSSKS